MNDDSQNKTEIEEQIARRLEHALKRSLTMPPKPITPKAKGQPRLKGRKVRPKKGE